MHYENFYLHAHRYFICNIKNNNAIDIDSNEIGLYIVQ